MRPGIQGSEGGELDRQVRVEELVHPQWLEQIAQVMRAEIAESGPNRQSVAGEELNCRGEKDLPTVTGSQQLRQSVEWRGEVIAALVWRRFPGVHRHPHAEPADRSPIFGKDCPLSSESSGNGSWGSGEGCLHCIPDRLEMDASMDLDRCIEQRKMAGNGLGHGEPVPLPECGTALDVGEEEGDGTGGEIGQAIPRSC